MRSTRASLRWLTLLAVGASLSSGCASTPPADPWASIAPHDEVVAQPVALGAWPAPVSETLTTVTFDLPGAVALLEFQTASEGNYRVAAALADQVTELHAEADHLVAAGRAQRRVADLLKEVIAEERRHHAWEKAGLYAAIVLLIAAGL